MSRSEKSFAVYIMASRRNGTLYIGVTSDLLNRVIQHRNGTFDGFTKKYKVHMLVWYEQHGMADTASTARSSSRIGTACGNCGSSRK